MIGAAALGTARWMLEQGREWIRSRVVFGKPISSYQSISFKYAELSTRLEAARLMVYRAAWLADKFYRVIPRFPYSILPMQGPWLRCLPWRPR